MLWLVNGARQLDHVMLVLFGLGKKCLVCLWLVSVFSMFLVG